MVQLGHLFIPEHKVEVLAHLLVYTGEDRAAEDEVRCKALACGPPVVVLPHHNSCQHADDDAENRGHYSHPSFSMQCNVMAFTGGRS